MIIKTNKNIIPKFLVITALGISSFAINISVTTAVNAAEKLEVLIAIDPADKVLTPSTSEISKKIESATGIPANVRVTTKLSEAMRLSRSSVYDVLVAPAHIAASGIGHSYKLLAANSGRRQFSIVANPQIKTAGELKGKKIFLPQQDALGSYMARGTLDTVNMSLQDFSDVKYQQNSRADLLALEFGSADVTIASKSQAEEWVKKNPEKGKILLTSRLVPDGLALLTHKKVPKDLESKITNWALSDMAIRGAGAFQAASEKDMQELVYLAKLGIFTPEQIEGVSRITAAELASLAKTAVLVDTRSEREYKAETIAGAIHAPYIEESLKERRYDAKLDNFSAIQKLDKSKPVVFFCNGPECWKSYKASDQARKLGFIKIYWFRGGMPEWRASGRAGNKS